MKILIFNLIVAIIALMMVGTLAGPALYRMGTMGAFECAMALWGAAVAWIMWAYVLIVEKVDDDIAEENRRLGL